MSLMANIFTLDSVHGGTGHGAVGDCLEENNIEVNMKLINDWTKAWKFTSVQTALIIAVVSALYAAWPAFMGAVPPFWYAVGMIVLSLTVVVMRLIQQRIE